MRRLLTWYLPLVFGVVLATLFAWGFAKGLQGNAGELVREASAGSDVRDVSGEEAERRATIDVVILGDSLARGTGDEIGEGIGGRLSSILEERDVITSWRISP
ncbi:MAG: hypothetical protein R3338_12800 [Thermoanaerobaculia bacterium]|nr:hypothetical protein [Thermoanaerobaculia bacterium]